MFGLMRCWAVGRWRRLMKKQHQPNASSAAANIINLMTSWCRIHAIWLVSYPLLVKAQLRRTGHVIRMEDHRLPRQLLREELKSGKRVKGRSSNVARTTLIAMSRWIVPELKNGKTHAPSTSWRWLAQEVNKQFVRHICVRLEASCERHHQAATVITTITDCPCSHYPGLCAPKLGLQNHHCVHQHQFNPTLINTYFGGNCVKINSWNMILC